MDWVIFVIRVCNYNRKLGRLSCSSFSAEFYTSHYSVMTDGNSKEKFYSVSIDVRDFCKKICTAVKDYMKNKSPHLFQNHSIKVINIEEEFNKLLSLND